MALNDLFARHSTTGGFPIARDARTNRRIRAREVRVIDADGKQLGVLPLEVALQKAAESGFDLVEVSPMAKPPVCKIMDYGKYKYEIKKKSNEDKKKQAVIKIKEVKMRPRTEEHDFNVKIRHTREFLEEGHKVKVTVVFRGREIAHREIGQQQLQEMLVELKDLCIVEQSPRMEGKAMFMMLAANPKAKPSTPAPSTTAVSAPKTLVNAPKIMTVDGKLALKPTEPLASPEPVVETPAAPVVVEPKP